MRLSTATLLMFALLGMATLVSVAFSEPTCPPGEYVVNATGTYICVPAANVSYRSFAFNAYFVNSTLNLVFGCWNEGGCSFNVSILDPSNVSRVIDREVLDLGYNETRVIQLPLNRSVVVDVVVNGYDYGLYYVQYVPPELGERVVREFSALAKDYRVLAVLFAAFAAPLVTAFLRADPIEAGILALVIPYFYAPIAALFFGSTVAGLMMSVTIIFGFVFLSLGNGSVRSVLVGAGRFFWIFSVIGGFVSYILVQLLAYFGIPVSPAVRTWATIAFMTNAFSLAMSIAAATKATSFAGGIAAIFGGRRTEVSISRVAYVAAIIGYTISVVATIQALFVGMLGEYLRAVGAPPILGMILINTVRGYAAGAVLFYTLYKLGIVGEE